MSPSSATFSLTVGDPMQVTVDFLKMPVSLSTGDYPLLDGLDMDLSGYIVETMSLNVRKDLHQMIRVVDFDGSEFCNMVRFRGYGLYWITARETSSDVNSAVSFVLSVCASSTILSTGKSVKGEFSRLPSNVCTYLKRQAVSGAMQYSRHVDLPTIGETSHGRMYWVEITSTVHLNHTDGSVASSDSLNRYGMFVVINSRGTSGDYVVANNATGEEQVYYPSIEDIISNPERLGFQASTIQDISISARCPYTWTGSDGLFRVNLTNVSGDVILPNTRGPDVVEITGGHYEFYRLNDQTKTFPPLVETVTMTLSSLERASGQVIIKTEAGSNISSIPTEWSGTITADVQCIGDMGKLLTIITIAGTEYTIPEGHLPFVGSQWAEYAAYAMVYDRQSMEQSISYANERMVADIAQGAAGAIQGAAVSAISGSGPLAIGTGLASFGLSTAGSLIERSISEREARDTRALAERRVQGQAGTPYNTAYGLIYNMYYHRHPACIQLDIPSGLTTSIDSTYTSRHGYPAEGVRTITMGEGYIQGRVFPVGDLTGPILDKANEELSNGITFKEI